MLDISTSPAVRTAFYQATLSFVLWQAAEIEEARKMVPGRVASILTALDHLERLRIFMYSKDTAQSSIKSLSYPKVASLSLLAVMGICAYFPPMGTATLYMNWMPTVDQRIWA